MTTVHAEFGCWKVVSSAQKMPSSCWGIYRRIAVMKCATPLVCPASIADCINYWPVEKWDRLHVGKTDRSEFSRTLKNAISDARRRWIEEMRGRSQRVEIPQ